MSLIQFCLDETKRGGAISYLRRQQLHTEYRAEFIIDGFVCPATVFCGLVFDFWQCRQPYTAGTALYCSPALTIPTVRLNCKHGHLLAEGWCIGHVLGLGGLLHSFDRPAEVVYSGKHHEFWHINGQYMPEFGLYVDHGEEGMAEYLRKHPAYHRRVKDYLAKKLPGKLLHMMELADGLL